MSRIYMSYDPEQRLLLPPDLREWLPEGHLALFISDVVDELDLRPILESYESDYGRGRPPYHPLMMVKLLIYGYCMGCRSSRKIEKATYEDVAFRVLACNQHPDHASIAEFRKRHLAELAKLFVQVLQLCQQAGLVKLGLVALDGSKLRANASKHKAMSYERMCEKEPELAAEVERLLGEAAAIDAAEDEQYGKGRRGDELPAELARRESRLRKIREAKAALEEEARAKAKAANAVAATKLEERQRREAETGKKTPGRTPRLVDEATVKPEAKAQRNFTDPESRIMKDGATGSYEQSYNAQIVVDSEAQIIVAGDLTQEANDRQQLEPMLTAVKTNTGRSPEKATADSGYFSVADVTSEALAETDLYVTPDKGKDTEQPLQPLADPRRREYETEVATRMRAKLQTHEGRAVYKQRKCIVEPVFGQVKEARGLRRFSFRGLAKNRAEWELICLTHNLLKLFRQRSARDDRREMDQEQGNGPFVGPRKGLSSAQKLAACSKVSVASICHATKIDLVLLVTDDSRLMLYFVASKSY